MGYDGEKAAGRTISWDGSKLKFSWELVEDCEGRGIEGEFSCEGRWEDDGFSWAAASAANYCS
jgi:hypothetical protein